MNSSHLRKYGLRLYALTLSCYPAIEIEGIRNQMESLGYAIEYERQNIDEHLEPKILENVEIAFTSANPIAPEFIDLLHQEFSASIFAVMSRPNPPTGLKVIILPK